MSAKIFSIEMIVSNIDIIKLPEDVCSTMKTCVLLRLFENIEIEICDPIGSLGNLKELSSKENCIFSLSNEWDATPVKASVNVFKMDERDQRYFIGRYDLNLQEIFKKLIKNQHVSKKESITTDQHTENDKLLTNPSGVSMLFNEPNTVASSLKSLKSQSINIDPYQHSTKMTSESIKGLFPLFNNDDDNVGFILLTLRITCYGNAILQRNLTTNDSYHGRQESTPNLFHLCSYKKSKNEETATIESSCSCVCHDTCSVEEKISGHSGEPCHPPSPVDSCVQHPEDEYDEYIQEINGNSLTIRIPKTANMKATVLDTNMENFRKKDNTMHHSRNYDNIAMGIDNDDNQHQSVTNVDLTNNCGSWKHEGCLCTRPKDCYKLPKIRGNLKYPNRIQNRQNLNLDVQRSSIKNLIKDFENRNFCMQTCDYDIKKESNKTVPLHMTKVMRPSVKKSDDVNDTEGRQSSIGSSNKIQENNEELDALKKQCLKGIEVCHKGSSYPDTDVYVLKLGKNETGVGNLEVELRTPKCTDLESITKNSVEVQVIEEEFEDYKSFEVGKKDTGKGKGGKKKNKGKKGKGKKK